MLPDDEVDDDEVGEEVEGEVDVGEVGDNVGNDVDDGEVDNDVDDDTDEKVDEFSLRSNDLNARVNCVMMYVDILYVNVVEHTHQSQ